MYAVSACEVHNRRGVCCGTSAAKSVGLLGFDCEWITLELSCLEPFLGHQELGARFCKVFYTLYSALVFTDYVSPQQGSVTPHAPFQYFHLICDLISS